MRKALLILLVCLCNFLFSQSNINTDTIAIDSTLPKVNTFKVIFSGEPGKAALYSFIVPGGGQIYNKKWWKVPLAIGIDGWFTYKYITHRKDFKKFDKIFKDYIAGIQNPEYSMADAQSQRDISRRNKEYGLVYMILGHLVTVFDAYVDRHLMDFDTSENLSSLPPSNYNNELTLISFKIPLNR